ncbi:hypothetical protein D9C73_015436 [Collichthys lucidus]|uniref:Uncharacterized protein n=1 Tax=Collichthys lucidus TaxID=240159 RepID=A0A4U5V2E1_COLLU|nr:hypothetical protein D9C73_015436 [Collichthys lucidus]
MLNLKEYEHHSRLTRAEEESPPYPLTTTDELPVHTASPEPDSAVVSSPPCPLTTTDELPVHTASPEPDSAVVSSPPYPLTTTDELPVHTASPEPDSAVVSSPPCPLTTTDEPPSQSAISSVQDELNITGQPVKVDESFITTTVVNKTKKSRFLNWIRKYICCCFVDGDDTAL